MKSRILSFSMVMDAFKRQLWVFVVGCLAFFAVYPLNGMLGVERWTVYNDLSPEALRRLFALEYWGTEAYVNGGLESVILVAVGLAVVTAINGFSYLHSRTKVDFYHSLPLRRESLFWQQVVVGLINYVIPAFFGVVLLMVVGAFRNLFTLKAFAGGLFSALVGLCFFLMTYALTVLAMLLTGRILVGCLGAAVFLGYAFLGVWASQWYFENFFYTYSGMLGGENSLWKYTSPIYWGMTFGGTQSEGGGGVQLLLTAVVTALLLALCLWIYKRRPSEAAGRAMTFSRVGSVIQVILTSTSALLGGMIFQSAVGKKSDIWFFFGVLCGLLLAYGAIQMIYEGNIRRLFAGKWKLLAAGLLALAVTAVFRFDLIGYDRYMPEQEEILSVGMDLSDFAQGMGDYIEPKEMIDHINLECNDQVYDFLEKLSSGAKGYAKEIEDPQFQWGDRESYSVNVGYKLKDHSVKYRRYEVFFDEIETELKRMYDNPEYLEQSNLIGLVEPEMVHDIKLVRDEYLGVLIYRRNDEQRLDLVNALLQDMSERNSEVMTKETPLAILQCSVNLTKLGFEGGWYRDNLEEELMKGRPVEAMYDLPVYIYPSYHRTVEILDGLGYLKERFLDEENAENIKKITVTRYNEKTDREEKKVYRKKAEIQKLLPRLVRSYLITPWMELESGSWAMVELKDNKGEQGKLECQILRK